MDERKNSKIKKDCIVINYTGRTGAGAGPVIAYEMATGLVNAGETVIPIISNDIANLDMWNKEKFEKVIQIKTYSNYLSYIINTLFFNIKIKKSIHAQLEGYRVKMVYCPMPTFWTPLVNNIFKESLKVMVRHDPYLHTGHRIIDPQTFLDPFKNADIIIVHSKRFIDIVKQTGKRVEYFPLGRHNMYRNVKNKVSIVTYDPKKINFVFFGRIEKYKGLDILAQAYKKLLSKYEDRISLTVVGSGDISPYEKDFENLSNVKIINRWIKDEETESVFLGKNLVSVCPYKDATQSGVVLVSYEYGVPVIATNTGGLPEQVFNNDTGFLVEPNDVNGFAEAMEKYITNIDLIEKQQIKIGEYLESISWDNSAKKLVTLIDQEQAK